MEKRSRTDVVQHPDNQLPHLIASVKHQRSTGGGANLVTTRRLRDLERRRDAESVDIM